MILRITGPIPSKKSLYRRRKGGGLYHDAKVKRQMDAIQLQIQAQFASQARYGPRGKDIPLFFRFGVQNEAQDRDGMLATCLDCMTKAGILRDDAVRYHNGTITLYPAIKGDVSEIGIGE